MPYYRRRTPQLWEEIAAVAAGAAAGLATHYLTRTLLRRDPLPSGEDGPEGEERTSASPDAPRERSTKATSR